MGKLIASSIVGILLLGGTAFAGGWDYGEIHQGTTSPTLTQLVDGTQYVMGWIVSNYNSDSSISDTYELNEGTSGETTVFNGVAPISKGAAVNAWAAGAAVGDLVQVIILPYPVKFTDDVWYSLGRTNLKLHVIVK